MTPESIVVLTLGGGLWLGSIALTYQMARRADSPFWPVWTVTAAAIPLNGFLIYALVRAVVEFREGLLESSHRTQ